MRYKTRAVYSNVWTSLLNNNSNNNNNNNNNYNNNENFMNIPSKYTTTNLACKFSLQMATWIIQEKQNSKNKRKNTAIETLNIRDSGESQYFLRRQNMRYVALMAMVIVRLII